MYKDQNLGTCNFLEGALEHFSNPVKLESSLKIGWFSVKTVCKKMKTSVNQLSAHVAEASSSIRRTTYSLFGSYYHDSKKRPTDFSWPKPFWPGLLKCSAARYQAISKSIPIILFKTLAPSRDSRILRGRCCQVRDSGQPHHRRTFEFTSRLLCFIFDESHWITGNLGCGSKFGCGMLLGSKNRFSQYCIRETGFGAWIWPADATRVGFIRMTHRSTSGHGFVQG